jgi:3-dehydroquinate synthase
MPAARWLDLMGHDKKVRGGRIRLVLLKGMGHAVTTGDYDPAALDATLAEVAGDG